MKMDRRLAVALGITALFGVATVRAAELGRVNVPFAFEALGQRLEAGTYKAGDNSGALVVRNDKTGQGIFLLPVPIGLANGGQSSMTFLCYGPQCFLSRIQFGDTHKIYGIGTSKREKELAKVARPQVTVVAMR